MSHRPIYYMEILVAYRKGKSMLKTETWCVSTYTTPSDITRKDSKTMNKLNQEFYNKSYKSKRSIAILDILSKKVIGKTNH